MAIAPPAGPAHASRRDDDRLGPIEAAIAILSSMEKLDLIERIARSIEPSLSTSQKLDLIERIARSMRPASQAPIDPGALADRAERQYRRRMELLAEIEAMPCAPNPDGLSGRDHDKILYGSP